VLPPDNHVHSEWSYDTGYQASMVDSCQRAIRLGLPAIAFTEHLDFSVWADSDPIADLIAPENFHRSEHSLDLDGYHACVAECRERFPGLRVLSGVEAGEPHLFSASLAKVLGGGDFDRVLGSLHAVPFDGTIVGVSGLYRLLDPDEVVRRYFAELINLVRNSDAFQVLAHVDFPRRYWPAWERPYDEAEYEEEYRSIFSALAASGRALEFNTRSPLASVDLIRWWWQEGGDAVSFGSDAHLPSRVGEHFDVAVAITESAGFRPGRDMLDFWRR
jgi:histidinol-phosphatase (PHP family)